MRQDNVYQNKRVKYEIMCILFPVTSPKVSVGLCLASGFIFDSAGHSNDAAIEL